MSFFSSAVAFYYAYASRKQNRSNVSILGPFLVSCFSWIQKKDEKRRCQRLLCSKRTFGVKRFTRVAGQAVKTMFYCGPKEERREDEIRTNSERISCPPLSL